MPNENIERAILRGTGQLEGEQFEEATFEGYGPGGVGLLIQVVTTNRNRIVGEFRHLMSKNGGNMAEAGAVGWMFHRKGEITVPKETATEDKMMDIVLEAGADDLKDDGSAWYIVTPPEALEKVKEALVKAGITPSSAEVGMVPQNYVKLTGAQATRWFAWLRRWKSTTTCSTFTLTSISTNLKFKRLSARTERLPRLLGGHPVDSGVAVSISISAFDGYASRRDKPVAGFS